METNGIVKTVVQLNQANQPISDVVMEQKPTSPIITPKQQIIVKALVAGAHALHITPIIVNKALGSKICRLPLHCWINSPKGRYFVPAVLMKQYGCTMADIAYAVHNINETRKAYIDSTIIDVADIAGLTEFMEKALFARKDNSTASLNTDQKLYIRDLNCPKPSSKGTAKSIAIAPDWLVSE